jgi:hypothetical protein
MIRSVDEVLPENRKSVNEYIGDIWGNVTTFVRSLKRKKGTEELRVKFQSHVAVEEAKLRKDLEDVKYFIDSPDVAHLISRHGRIETVRLLPLRVNSPLTLVQTLFPMLYLTLKRDLEKISLARKHVLADSELPDSVETIYWITDAAMDRISDLEGEK